MQRGHHKTTRHAWAGDSRGEKKMARPSAHSAQVTGGQALSHPTQGRLRSWPGASGTSTRPESWHRKGCACLHRTDL